MDRYQLTFKAWDNVADAYNTGFMDLDLYNDTYEYFCELVKNTEAHILEIGCGPGNITRYLATKRPDFRIQALDVSPNMIKLAKQNVPGASFEVMDAREISKLNSKYDGIVCGFCVPYLSKEDLATLINDCAMLLPSNGVLYLSAIEGSYNKSGFETGSNSQNKMFVYYYREADIQQQLNNNGFELTKLFRKGYTRKDGSTSIHLIFIATKQ